MLYNGNRKQCGRKEFLMEKIEGFSAVGIDEVEWSEFTSSWSIKRRNLLRLVIVG